MSGLAGWVDYKNVSPPNIQKLQRMSHSLLKRGGGEIIFYSDDNCSLINTVTPSNAENLHLNSVKMGEKEYTLIFDGKLFNTEEIKNELILSGESLSGKSDAELILKAYIRWGANCLSRLNGVYAFAVWEKQSRTLFAARDRVGVKPFFFYEYDGGFLFASEIKALMSSGIIPAEIDKTGLYQMLLLGPARPCGSGIIKGIKELLPGEYLVYNKDGIKRHIYWKLTASPHKDNPSETVEKTRWLVTDAITRQLVSDKPLACFLSGGLDSSIISYIAAEKFREEGRTLTTYSVDYEGNDKNFVSNSFQPDADNKYIDIMRNAIRSDHHFVMLNNLDVAKAIEDAAVARDLPGMADIDSSLLLFCKEIKKNYSVCVSGESADELFGGYPWYHNPDILFTEGFPWSNTTELRQNLFVKGLLGNDSQDFVLAEYRKTVDSVDYSPEDSPHARRMREMFSLNFYWFMQTLVDRKDRMCAAAGVEPRVPYCDHRIVEYAYNMPWELKSLNGREKGILRRAFADLLPKEIIERKKSPYPKTYSPVYFNWVVEKAESLIADKTSILSEIVNKDFLDSLKANPDTLKAPWYGQLMRVPQIYGYLVQLDTIFREFDLKFV